MRSRFLLILACLAILLGRTPVYALDWTSQKLVACDSLLSAANRGDSALYARYLKVLETDVAAVEKEFALTVPPAPTGKALGDVTSALLIAWAYLLTDHYAHKPDVTETDWRLVQQLLLRGNEGMLRLDTPLFHLFQKSVAQLRVVRNGAERDAILHKLRKPLREMLHRTLGGA